MADTNLAAASLDSSLGSLEIGVFAALTLYGLMVAQMHTYYQSSFQYDSRWLRFILALIFISETIHSAFLATYVYESTIKDFGHPEKLFVPHWSLGFSIPVGNVATVLVQGFFAYRIHILSHSWFITILSWIGSFGRISTAWAIASIQHVVGELNDFDTRFTGLIITYIVVGVAVDVLNTTSLIFLLWSARRKLKNSRKLADTLLLWTMETGLLTTLCNLSILILYFSLPNTTAFLSPGLTIAKMYSNSLLASLNGRLILRSTGVDKAITLSGMHPTKEGGDNAFRLANAAPKTLTTIEFGERPVHLIKDPGTSTDDSSTFP